MSVELVMFGAQCVGRGAGQAFVPMIPGPYSTLLSQQCCSSLQLEGGLCFTFGLVLFLQLSPLSCISPQGPAHAPSLGQAGFLVASALSLMLSQPQAVATQESRLPATSGLGKTPKHAPTVFWKQALRGV